MNGSHFGARGNAHHFGAQQTYENPDAVGSRQRNGPHQFGTDHSPLHFGTRHMIPYSAQYGRGGWNPYSQMLPVRHDSAYHGMYDTEVKVEDSPHDSMDGISSVPMARKKYKMKRTPLGRPIFVEDTSSDEEPVKVPVEQSEATKFDRQEQHRPAEAVSRKRKADKELPGMAASKRIVPNIPFIEEDGDDLSPEAQQPGLTGRISSQRLNTVAPGGRPRGKSPLMGRRLPPLGATSSGGAQVAPENGTAQSAQRPPAHMYGAIDRERAQNPNTQSRPPAWPTSHSFPTQPLTSNGTYNLPLHPPTGPRTLNDVGVAANRAKTQPAYNPFPSARKLKTPLEGGNTPENSPDRSESNPHLGDTRRVAHDRKVTELSRKDIVIWKSFQDFPDGSRVEKDYADAYAQDAKSKLPRSNEKPNLKKVTLQKQCRTLNRMMNAVKPTNATISSILRGGAEGAATLKTLNDHVFFALTRWDKPGLTLADLQLWKDIQDGKDMRSTEERYASATGISVARDDLDLRYKWVSRLFREAFITDDTVSNILDEDSDSHVEHLNALLTNANNSPWIAKIKIDTLEKQPEGQPEPSTGQAPHPSEGGKHPTWAWYDVVMGHKEAELQDLAAKLQQRAPGMKVRAPSAGGWFPQHVFSVMKEVGDGQAVPALEALFTSMPKANRAAMDCLAGHATGAEAGTQAVVEAVADFRRQIREAGVEGQPFDGEANGAGDQAETMVRVFVEARPLTWG